MAIAVQAAVSHASRRREVGQGRENQKISESYRRKTCAAWKTQKVWASVFLLAVMPDSKAKAVSKKTPTSTPQKQAATTKKKVGKAPNCIKQTKAIIGITGPINMMVFLPGFSIYKGARDGLLDPLFGNEVTFPVAMPPTHDALTGYAMLLSAILLIVVGLMITVSAMRQFYAAGGTIEGEDAPPVLVVSGPYGYVRNPLLLAYLLVLIGETLLTGLPELIVFTILLWVGMSIWLCCRCASPTASDMITSAIRSTSSPPLRHRPRASQTYIGPRNASLHLGGWRREERELTH